MSRCAVWFLVWLGVGFSTGGQAQDVAREIPEPLRSWKDWVLWNETRHLCPSPFNDSQARISVWPSELKLQANADGGEWEVQVRVFAESWVPLPGDREVWPIKVTVDDRAIAVIEKEGLPAVWLSSGLHLLRGQFRWGTLPQKMAIPKNFGVIELSIEGESVSIPNWDEEGFVWLKRLQATDEVEDQITLQIYRVIEDGVPMWLRTQVEVTASGKSREEALGNILPDGWQLSYVSSPIPVALDEQGKMKAQVRPGTWLIQIDAFRNQDLRVLRYGEGVIPAVERELIAVRARPELRTAELQGAIPVDVQMTTFPQAWRDLPVFEWSTAELLPWVEKARGTGLLHPDQLSIQRLLWMDEDGKGFTYQDRLRGQPKQIARLDVAPGHELGVVRVNGERQLITENPATGGQGIELRAAKPNLEAVGRVKLEPALLATGWQSDADSLNLTLMLPPGWRVYALFGADRVEGDWLTAWSLLDLFLLLIFSVAVYRLWGIWAGLIAFVALGLSYHEPGSPRLTWLFLLAPLAVLRVVQHGRAVPWLKAWRLLAIVLLMINLIPFIATQVQNGLYPQLERVGVPYSSRSMFDWLNATYNASAAVADYVLEDASVSYDSSNAPVSETQSYTDRSMVPSKSSSGKLGELRQSQSGNLQFASGTNIQTGMAKPAWQGNQIRCHWDGPVSRDHRIYPLLISRDLHRLLTVVRLLFLGGLMLALLRGSPILSGWPLRRTSVSKALLFIGFGVGLPSNQAWSQIPDEKMLDTLRQRLLQPSDAFPRAAEIPTMSLRIEKNRLSMEGEIHAAAVVAVPVPGRFPIWSPLRILVDDQPATVSRRDDGYLWVYVSQGVHTFQVEGFLEETPEWVWSFALTPRHLELAASEWNVTGLSPEGLPEDQLFFVKKEQRVEGAASYDQKNYRPVVVIDRQLEVGLVWKIHSLVKRLSPTGKALSLQVPLLKNERVLSSNLNTVQGSVEVNLGAEEVEFRWESEIQIQDEVTLEASSSGQSVERWSLISSPVWNLSFAGLQPMYESSQGNLLPVWNPWPGEKVTLSFRRPVAIPGKTLTIQRVQHQLSLGSRQRTSHFECLVESSLGGEFPLELPESTMVTSLSIDKRPLPIRRDGNRYLVSLQPGVQTLEVDWNDEEALTTVVEFPAVNLPTEAANVSMTMNIPESRWILWADGPARGPAVRFWIVLITGVLLALALASHPLSPLGRVEWSLLALGLTQIHVLASLLVIAWLFLIAWRGKTAPASMPRVLFRLLQIFLVGFTLVVLGIFVLIVGAGLLGSPEMFVLGNGSYRNFLSWFEPLSDSDLTRPRVVSISVWYYRLLMLGWALWLANALIGWLKKGWRAFSYEGTW